MKIVRGTAYFKLVFFGTALAGKTTILEWLFRNAIPDEMKLTGEMTQIRTSFGQTLVFDFAPIQVSENAVARIYSATGQDYYRGTRGHILAGADGIFLVVDSQRKELEHNVELIEELRQHFEEQESLDQAQVVVLFNKQDLEDAYPVEDLRERLGVTQWPGFGTSALTGENLVQALLTMLRKLGEKYESQGVLVA